MIRQVACFANIRAVSGRKETDVKVRIRKRRKKNDSGRCLTARASFTVETALLMPVLIFAIVMSVYLTVHVMNRTVLASSCAEQAVSGHTQEVNVLFASGAVSWKRTDDENTRTVSAQAATLHYSGSELWRSDSVATYQKIRPVTAIRIARKAWTLRNELR